MVVPLVPVGIFCSFADADVELFHTFEQHLSSLKSEGLITLWHKRQIGAGTNREQAIDHFLNTASVVLLLVSPDFMASEYCYSTEMRRAMQRHETNEAYVVPILLRPVDCELAPFGKLQALPFDGRPITSWDNVDEAFFDVARGLRSLLARMFHGTKKSSVKSVAPLLVQNNDTSKQGFHGELSLLERRFEGPSGQRLLVEVLKTQKMVAGDAVLAEELAHVVEVQAIRPGETIIQQGTYDNDIFFILSGRFSIVVNGKMIAVRSTDDHVGEMAVIDPAMPRSATVVAEETSVVCKLSEAQFAEIGQRHGAIWRNCSKELAKRLAQRSAFIVPVRESIRVLLLSSAKALPIAREIENHFEHDDSFSLEIWRDGVFSKSYYPIEAIKKAMEGSDFALIIAQDDDFVNLRGKTQVVPRDHILFELGVSIGHLGLERTLLLEPRSEEVKFPTDLYGVTTVNYQYGNQKSLSSLLGPACNRIRKMINELGPRN